MRILVAATKPGALTELLERWGHDVEPFEQAGPALERLESELAPRLVLWEWNTPGAEPLSICRRLGPNREGPSRHLVIALERFRRPEARQALEAGADDVLLLPVEELDLDLRLRVARRSLTLREQLEMALQRSRQDPLTGLWNRETTLSFLGSELARAERRDESVGLVVVDLDRFRELHGRLGEEAGNQVLKEVARRLRTTVRTSDWLGRTGADRFQVILPGCNEERVRRTGERMHRALAAVTAGDGVPLGFSLGACAGRAREVAPAALLTAARTAVRRAKEAGGNRLHLETA